MQPVEADAIDPQQRVLLETVYEGLESAGLTIEGLQGSSTAVYLGMMGCDYADVVQGDIECTPTYADEWQAYVDEHLEELDIDETETHNATQWIAKAKEIGFSYMLAAQNFDMTGESALPITQRR
ncbi:uncharacterized protein LDX57_004395 [Aspergillus melleus]|uniref:uncharacterized protein n=1 Tax=Aspergillus melleus TaxID=138277 RepID=UPI001E8D6234|nr:uncharacterized protein LDX57_004395 [Aspergillus melleus]KAH8426661.1 hypothetical protein LDX57_004395 [Aspergillus melleus]